MGFMLLVTCLVEEQTLLVLMISKLMEEYIYWLEVFLTQQLCNKLKVELEDYSSKVKSNFVFAQIILQWSITILRIK